ncbi:acyl transferase/acyl hydrolase/lysophospholipase [Dendryphion nanum]|uniref:Acyl transferase/acyl hydrolase/lysophospholipase n=1 Tax=Dendryphion nanum TaxID=256645 RepID=A0A9P9CZV3_9PLEO|nr:acyl transferase/acyl hydrolase/lysophospholipase [Dendryphion nanum]
MANTTHHSPSPGKKVLSLDGGGVRGLSSLLILRHLMKELGLKLQPPKPDLKPCEYFDLIGGTSTGGIIALMLGRLRMSVQECIDEYTALSRHIFKRKRHLGSSGPTFYAEDLEKALKKVIGERLGLQNEEAPLRDPLGEEACKTFVVTLQNQHAKSAQRLRTYPSGSEVPCTIWQAARATSAASTFFESITFGNPAVEWIDAGLGYNNPAEEVLDEAQILWEDDDGGFDAKRQIGVFVSLGTGIPEVFRPEKEKSFPRTILDDIAKRAGIPPDVIKQMKDIVTDSEKVHGRMIPRFRGPGRDNYYRFNVDSLGNIGLGDYEREEIMTVDTNAYLQRETYRMRDCTILMKKFPVYETLLNRNVDEVELEGTVGQTM